MYEGRVLRKRRQPVDTAAPGEAGVEQLLALAEHLPRLLLFTGSGLSATSGMSTFSTRGGLYERAQKRFRTADGKKLFTYAFFDRNRPEALAFFADIHDEAQAARPSPGHHAIAALARLGALQRHYTLNIDGLAEAVGLSVWHPATNPKGHTVELHGSINQLVCPSCHQVSPVSAAQLAKLRAKAPIPCAGPRCRERPPLRLRIMLYDDAEDEAITPADVFEALEADVRAADLILWVGISFEQSASTEYFRRVRRHLQEAGRLQACRQAIVNLSDEALWNVLSSSCNQGAGPAPPLRPWHSSPN